MICTGNGADHCCYLNSEVCVYLEEGTVPGRRWSCGLFRELGSWDKVHTDQRYQPIQAFWDQINAEVGRVVIPSCGEWQPKSTDCCQVVS